MIKTVVWTMALMGLVCSCGQSSLTGSVNEVFSLAYTKQVVLQQGTNLIIEYQSGTDVVCRVSFDTTKVPIAINTQVTGTTFLNNVHFQRAAADTKDYAALNSGEITFSAYNFTVGSKISGHFDALFFDTHTLVGDFEGTLTAL